VGLARAILRKYRPRVIGVTGSTGKTTAKEAIWLVLQGSFRTAKSQSNANTEWGITATVIDPAIKFTTTTDGRAKITFGHYCRLVIEGIRKLVGTATYPEFLVLELAADRPGDIKFFNRFLKYDVVVITGIGQVHLEYYRDQDQLTAEKLALVDGLKPSGLVVVNGDNPLIRPFIQSTPLRKVAFGWEDYDDYIARMVGVTETGIEVALRGPRGEQIIQFPFGRQLVWAALIALAVGEEFGLSPVIVGDRLSQMQSPRGRFEIWQLRRGITIISDAYNANPDSMKMALTSLQDIASVSGGQSPAKPQRRRVAVLGGMRELGSAHDSAHREVGRFLRDKVDLLIAVGKDGALMAESAQTAGFTQAKIILVPDIGQVDFSKFLQDNDAVLVKASRSFGLDRVAQLIKQRIGQ